MTPAQQQSLRLKCVVWVLVAGAGSVVLLVFGTVRCSTDPGSLGNAWATAVSDYCRSSGLATEVGGGLDVALIAAATLGPLAVMLIGAFVAVRLDSKNVLRGFAVAGLLAWIGSVAFLLRAAEVTFQGGAGG